MIRWRIYTLTPLPSLRKGFTFFSQTKISMSMLSMLIFQQSLQRKNKKHVHSRRAMMGKDYKFVEYLRYETDLDEEACIDTQILHYLYDYLEEIKLGYRDEKQKINWWPIYKRSKVLCVLCAEVLESPPSSRVPYPPRQPILIIQVHFGAYRNEENGHKVSLLFSYIYSSYNRFFWSTFLQE